MLTTVFALLLVAAPAPSTAAPSRTIFLNINPSWSPDGGRLVFQSEREGHTQLYVIGADGTGERRLTWSLGEDTHPAWSPDGAWILFDSDRDGVWNLYAIRPDGGDERRLTHPGAQRTEEFARHPFWSPDGKRMVFDSDRDGAGWTEVYVANADGSEPRRLTRSAGGAGHASFTPDGRSIVFSAGKAKESDVFVMDADGGNPRRLTFAPGADAGAKMSPDGRTIAFFSERDGGKPEIYAMDADGGNPRNLTRNAATEYELNWSPDGKRIAYYSDAPGRFEIFVMDADGGNAKAVTSTGYENAWPAWSPDGRRIVFGSTREGGDWEIYTMDADGGAPQRLTSSPGRDAHPQWSRDGKRILFQSPRDWNGEGQVSIYEMPAVPAAPSVAGAVPAAPSVAGAVPAAPSVAGEPARRLVGTGVFDGVPEPSRDGRRVAFMRGTLHGEKYHWDLWLIEADGKTRALTQNAWSSQVPTWGPGDRTIAFHADPMGQNRLFTMDVETTNVTPLLVSTGDFVDEVPSYSPDGSRLAFVSTRGRTRDLYLLEIGSGRVSPLTKGMDVWSQASWSPDGRRILFSAKTRELDDVYVINADGTGLTRLTKGLEGER